MAVAGGESLLCGKELVKRISALQTKASENDRCANCLASEPAYICMDFRIFVCKECSDIHRDFGHKVSCISNAEMDRKDLENIIRGGNKRAAQEFLAFWKPADFSRPTKAESGRMRDFIRKAYVVKCWQRQPKKNKDSRFVASGCGQRCSSSQSSTSAGDMPAAKADIALPRVEVAQQPKTGQLAEPTPAPPPSADTAVTAPCGGAEVAAPTPPAEPVAPSVLPMVFLQKDAACFCSNHDASAKRLKREPAFKVCGGCKLHLQTNYESFAYCPGCSALRELCMICGAPAGMEAKQQCGPSDSQGRGSSVVATVQNACDLTAAPRSSVEKPQTLRVSPDSSGSGGPSTVAAVASMNESKIDIAAEPIVAVQAKSVSTPENQSPWKVGDLLSDWFGGGVENQCGGEARLASDANFPAAVHQSAAAPADPPHHDAVHAVLESIPGKTSAGDLLNLDCIVVSAPAGISSQVATYPSSEGDEPGHKEVSGGTETPATSTDGADVRSEEDCSSDSGSADSAQFMAGTRVVQQCALDVTAAHSNAGEPASAAALSKHQSSASTCDLLDLDFVQVDAPKYASAWAEAAASTAEPCATTAVLAAAAAPNSTLGTPQRAGSSDVPATPSAALSAQSSGDTAGLLGQAVLQHSAPAASLAAMGQAHVPALPEAARVERPSVHGDGVCGCALSESQPDMGIADSSENHDVATVRKKPAALSDDVPPTQAATIMDMFKLPEASGRQSDAWQPQASPWGTPPRAALSQVTQAAGTDGLVLFDACSSPAMQMSPSPARSQADLLSMPSPEQLLQVDSQQLIQMHAMLTQALQQRACTSPAQVQPGQAERLAPGPAAKQLAAAGGAAAEACSAAPGLPSQPPQAFGELLQAFHQKCPEWQDRPAAPSRPLERPAAASPPRPTDFEDLVAAFKGFGP